MRIRIVGHEGQPNFPFGVEGPWRDFANEIEASGHEIVESNFGDDVDALVANSHNIEAINESITADVPLNRRILLIWEPRVVDNFPYTKKRSEFYGLVYAPSVLWARKLESLNFKWPQTDFSDYNLSIQNWKKRKNKAVIVQANKFSLTRNEQYSTRRAVLVLDEKLQRNIELYGHSWNLGRLFDFKKSIIAFIRTPKSLISFAGFKHIGYKYSSYRGPIENKYELISGYKVAIVIENSPDYVSEKLFDAIFSGAIAIYVGPSLATFGIPKDTAIQIENDAASINNKVQEILELTPQIQFEIACNQRDNISQVANEWNNRIVLKGLAQNIVLNLEKTFLIR
jgi:hypothetical protein